MCKMIRQRVLETFYLFGVIVEREGELMGRLMGYLAAYYSPTSSISVFLSTNIIIAPESNYNYNYNYRFPGFYYYFSVLSVCGYFFKLTLLFC